MTSDNLHSCEWLESISTYPLTAIAVLQQDGAWSISYRSFASAQDVASGEADNVGEIIGNFSIGIRFCPFCGKQLVEDNFQEKPKTEIGAGLITPDS